MKNIKFYNTKNRIASLVLAGTVFVTTIGLSGCSNKKENASDVPATRIEIAVDNTDTKIDSLMPEMNDEITRNTSILLLLDMIAKPDANGKVNAEEISKLKSRIDADNMVQDFNNFQDDLQKRMLTEKRVIRISETLPEELSSDKLILSKIEDILDDIFKSENNNQALVEFNKLYSLFAEGKELEIDGTKFKISDLNLVLRAIANTYAETATAHCRNYISDEQAKVMDNVLNDQNNKAEIRTRLEVLYNLIDGKSEIDVLTAFNEKYDEINRLINGKVNLSQETVKNLVNYENIKYLDSDKVTKEDKDKVVGEYTDEKVNDAILAIDVIQTYNLNHPEAIIPFSALLIDEYLKTDIGKIDKTALDFVQFNSLNLISTKDKAISEDGTANYNKLRNNPYFANIFKYLTKDDFIHRQKENGKEVDYNIIWQEISNGAHFVNDEIILFTLNKLPVYENLNNNIEVAQTNLFEIVAALQKSINGECLITDYSQFVKTK